jgi:CelD/BcsL family acetyltransferase involved in cellulose biosynthesis
MHFVATGTQRLHHLSAQDLIAAQNRRWKQIRYDQYLHEISLIHVMMIANNVRTWWSCMEYDSLPKLRAELATWPLDSAFRSQWDGFIGSNPHISPFCRLEWMELGIAVFGKNERILPYRFLDTQGKVRAMGLFQLGKEPGKLFPRTVLRTIEYNSQRINPFLTSDPNIMAAAIIALTETVGEPIDSFDFFKLDPLDGALQEVSVLLRKQGVSHELREFNEQPYFPLDGSWVEYLSERTQGHRKRIRRYTRKLQEQYGDYRFTRNQQPTDFPQSDMTVVLDEVMSLFDKSWQADALDKRDALYDMKRFYTGVAETFLRSGTLDLLFGAYDRDYADWSPGNAILSEILQDSYLKGYRRVEFGGEYLDYKKLWTKISSCSYHLRIHGTTLKATVKRLLSR